MGRRQGDAPGERCLRPDCREKGLMVLMRGPDGWSVVKVCLECRRPPLPPTRPDGPCEAEVWTEFLPPFRRCQRPGREFVTMGGRDAALCFQHARLARGGRRVDLVGAGDGR